MKKEKNTTTQPKPRKVRGTGIYLGDEFSFKPSEEGTPSQLNVKTCKGGKLFKTTSEKEPKQVAHLSCDANAADPFAEYISQLDKLGIRPLSEQQLPTKQRLVAEGGMTVYLDGKENLLVYQGSIDLTKNQNWQSEVMRQLQVIVRSLPAERKFTQLISKLKKGGTK